jgi:phosphoribosylformimino-5-aminoimidazole carboxamide ribotide isomerase
MLVVPAIDLLDGRCVRLHQGDYAQAETYDLDPVEVARGFAAAGARRLHLVDLDAARTGAPTNRAVIGAVRRAVDITVEVGGGLRTDEDVRALVDLGVDRLVVGTALVRNPDRVADWVARFGARFVAGIDARDGEVKIAGWEEGSALRDIDLAAQCRALGLLSIVYTNIARDGTLGGPDLERTLLVAEAAGLPVVLSGGIASLADFDAVRRADHPLLAGVITGKALYRNRIDLAEVIAKYQDDRHNGGTW